MSISKSTLACLQDDDTDRTTTWTLRFHLKPCLPTLIESRHTFYILKISRHTTQKKKKYEYWNPDGFISLSSQMDCFIQYKARLSHEAMT